MKKLFIFIPFLLSNLFSFSNLVFASEKIDIEKVYLAVCNSPEQQGSVEKVLKVYNVKKDWPIVMTEGMCWFPGKGVVYRGFSLIKTEEINGRIIRLVESNLSKIDIDISSTNDLRRFDFKVVPITGYVYWKTNYRFLVCSIVEADVYLKNGRIIKWVDPDWNGDLALFRNKKLLEEEKYFK